MGIQIPGMITPPFLKPGDKVAIVATARKVSVEEINPAISAFQSWGLQVETGQNLFESENQFAGTDEQRLADFQQMLDNPEVKAIICARGGYGTVRIIDQLNFTNFVKSPKWIVGYSDITVLHSHIHQHFGIETLHATMPLNFPADGSSLPSMESLRKCLFGESPEYLVKSGKLSRKGNAEGQLIGGNLSILYSLAGTASDIDTDGKILFIEDLDEYLYHVDRMMMNLKRGGKLDNLAGLVVGGMTQMRDNAVPYGKTAEEIIADSIKEFKYPVLFDFPAGHQEENMSLILGRDVVLEVSDQSRMVFKPKKYASGNRDLKGLIKPGLYILGFFALLYLLYDLLISNL